MRWNRWILLGAVLFWMAMALGALVVIWEFYQL